MTNATDSTPQNHSNKTIEFNAYLNSNLDDDNIIKVKKIYILVCDNKGSDGLLFSQLMYWMPRATIEKNGKKWVAKTYDEWEGEIGINARTARRIIDRLKTIGLIETEVFKFKGHPTVHIRVIGEKFIELRNAIMDKSISPEWTEPYVRNGQNEMTDSDSSYTKTTAKTTKEKEQNPILLKFDSLITQHLELIEKNPHLTDKNELDLVFKSTKKPTPYQIMSVFFGKLWGLEDGAKEQTPDSRSFTESAKQFLLAKRQTVKDLIDFVYWYCEQNPDYEYLPGTAKSKTPAENVTTFELVYSRFLAHKIEENESAALTCETCKGLGMYWDDDGNKITCNHNL